MLAGARNQTGARRSLLRAGGPLPRRPRRCQGGGRDPARAVGRRAREVAPPLGINPSDVVELDPPWNQITIGPGKAADEIVVSYVHVRARAGRQENVFRQLVLGLGAPGPSPAIVQEREEPRRLSSSPPMAPDRLPLVTAPACPATVEESAGPLSVVTGAHAKYSGRSPPSGRSGGAGEPAEIVAGRWLLPPSRHSRSPWRRSPIEARPIVASPKSTAAACGKPPRSDRADPSRPGAW